MTTHSLKRVAMLSVHTCPLAALGGKKTGGMNVYVRELSRELSRQGIAVDVYTRSQNPCIPHINDSLAGNARVIHVPTGPETPLETDEVYPHLPQFVANVLDYAASNNRQYDVIYSHYWLSGWAAHDLRAAWQVPVVQMFHTLGHMKNRIAGRLDQPTQDIRIRTEREIMRWADLLIAATPAERAQMLWLYQADRRKIRVIPPGVDLKHFQPLDRPDAKIRIGLDPTQQMLLFVGRIEPLKAVDSLLRAVALVREWRPDLAEKLVLSVIGGDPGELHRAGTEMARLYELREAFNLQRIVKFLGAQDQDRLRYYYNAAEALIMPSDYESFGMVALEAMASGTPVIASEVGGLAFLVQDGVTGMHVPVRDPKELAYRIISILDDPAARTSIGQAARLAAQQYGWDQIAGQLIALFSALHGGQQALAEVPAGFWQEHQTL